MIKSYVMFLPLIYSKRGSCYVPRYVILVSMPITLGLANRFSVPVEIVVTENMRALKTGSALFQKKIQENQPCCNFEEYIKSKNIT